MNFETHPFGSRVVWFDKLLREVITRMSKTRDEILRDIIATVVLGVLCFQAMQLEYALVASLTGGGIGLVNTLTVSDLYRAVLEVRRENRRQQSEGSET